MLKDFHFDTPHKQFEFARTMRHIPTEAERLLWERLRKRQVDNYYFRRQHPLSNYIADFYCHSQKLIIEVDGNIHNSPEAIEYDKSREYVLKEFGYTIIRINNSEIFEDIDSVIKKIAEVLKSLHLGGGI
jgi:very-short-patch-repair endonuclease